MKNIKSLLQIANNQFEKPFIHKEFHLMIPKKDVFEYETKVEIISGEDLQKTLNNIKLLNVLKFEHRSEQHHLFEMGNDSVLCLVLIRDLDEIWIKIKSETKTKKIGDNEIPLILRKGDKFKPGEKGYRSAYEKIEFSKYFKSYNKECVNYFFRYNNLFYSLSLSLADNQRGFVHAQMEFEYEGFLQGTEIPGEVDIAKELELLFKNKFHYLIGRFNSETKYEALKKRQDS